MIFLIRKTICLFLAFEVVVFVIMYCFGPNSLKTLYDMHREKNVLLTEIRDIKHKNDILEQDIACSSTDFAKERIAREKLLMKRNNETVYFVKD